MWSRWSSSHEIARKGPRSQPMFTTTSKTLGEVESNGPVRKPRVRELSFVMTGSVTLTEANTFVGDLTPLTRVWTALCSGTATNMREGQVHQGKKKFLFPWGPCPGVNFGVNSGGRLQLAHQVHPRRGVHGLSGRGPREEDRI